jgi:hypothetical protein
MSTPPRQIESAARRAAAKQGGISGGEIVFGNGGRKYWERLTLGDKRIVGVLRFPAKQA